MKTRSNNTQSNAKVDELVSKLKALPEVERAFAFALIGLLSGGAVPPDLFWRTLPKILAMRRNDKYRLARVLNKLSEVELGTVEDSAAADFAMRWAATIKHSALYARYPDIMQTVIKNCVPAASSSN